MEIIAHRGDSAHHTENTAAAFSAALAAGADGIETDLRLSADGEIFLFHDDSGRRLLDRPGRIEAETASTLREWRYRDGQSLLSLGDFFALLKSLQPEPAFLINLELKGTDRQQCRMAEQLAQRFRAGSWTGVNILVSSFKPTGLQKILNLAPELPRAFLWSGRTPFSLALRRAEALKASAFHIALKAATPDRLAEIREAGFPCRVYTVNEPVDATALEKQGVSGIFTDDPVKIISTRIHQKPNP